MVDDTAGTAGEWFGWWVSLVDGTAGGYPW